MSTCINTSSTVPPYSLTHPDTGVGPEPGMGPIFLFFHFFLDMFNGGRVTLRC
jgi:hypothetical protein